MSPRRTHGYGKYAYPASYSYYPTRQGYAVKKKKYYPLILLVLGIVVAIYGFMAIPKIEPTLNTLANTNPDMQIAGLVFCDPCSGIDGENMGIGKRLVIDTALAVRQLSLVPGVKQVRLLGQV